MGWKIIVARLTALIALDLGAPAFSSGPANAGRYYVGWRDSGLNIFDFWMETFLGLIAAAITTVRIRSWSKPPPIAVSTEPR